MGYRVTVEFDAEYVYVVQLAVCNATILLRHSPAWLCVNYT
jgi:hypothetical protein